MKTLLVDNYDSFTYNLYQLIGEVNGVPPTVVCNDADFASIDKGSFDNIVISPGPGNPSNGRDFGLSRRLIQEADCPVLGVCLGHQGICDIFGGSVVLAPQPYHGRISLVFHTGDGLWEGLPNPFEVTRYHSLVGTSLSAVLQKSAWTADNLLMGVTHLTRPIWGVQFHPESICSSYGHELLANFRGLTPKRTASAAAHAAPRTAPAEQTSPYRVEVRRLEHEPDAAQAFAQLFVDSKHSYWLDSSAVIEDLSRFTLMGDGAGPLAEYLTYDVQTQMTTVERSSGDTVCVVGPFFEYLNQSLAARRLPKHDALPIDFNLGYIGFLGYELKAETGGYDAHAATTPDAGLLFADRAVIIDHVEHRTYVLELRHATDAKPSAWLPIVCEQLRQSCAAPPTKNSTPLHQPLDTPDAAAFRHSRQEYLERISLCQEEIRTGESYEICLTNMGVVPGALQPFSTYLHLRQISQAPYAALLMFPGVNILSASPERFLKIDCHGNVESKPIKGTRPRGKTPAEDRAYLDDLANSEKDRAENLMIVDLVRNDLNRSCTLGSVHVPKLFAVETFASSHQLISTVGGVLRPTMSPVDCVRNAFPGGSMTGAPKVRTMEIIDRLEGGARGIYSGALGWFALSGAVDLNIVIRTIVATENEATFGVGGAIIALSDPDDEFEETAVKMRAMITALATARGGK